MRQEAEVALTYLIIFVATVTVAYAIAWLAAKRLVSMIDARQQFTGAPRDNYLPLHWS
jgi:hypothetical protein